MGAGLDGTRGRDRIDRAASVLLRWRLPTAMRLKGNAVSGTGRTRCPLILSGTTESGCVREAVWRLSVSPIRRAALGDVMTMNGLSPRRAGHTPPCASAVHTEAEKQEMTLSFTVCP